MIPPALRKLRLENQTATPDHLQLARSIEQLINTGELKEGQRLPSTTELVKLWGTNITRIQRTMNVLVANGLLQRHPRRGSFVTPRENRPSIGILVGPDMLPEANQFYRLLVDALRTEIRKKGLIPRIYDALASQSAERSRSLEDFKYDLRHRTFSALALVSLYSDDPLKKSGIIDSQHESLPSVSYTTPKASADVHIDYYDFAHASVTRLAAAGCRNIAYFPSIMNPSYRGHLLGFEDAMRAAGLKAPRHAIVHAEELASNIQRQTVDRNAYASMQKALQDWKRKKYVPDGILISDDIQAKGIIAAIQSVLPPKQKPPRFIVLATLNSEPFYPLPAMRYSISVAEIAKAMLARLSLSLLGEPLPGQPDRIKGELTEEFC